MDNHYHLLVETPEANLSKGMKQLNGQYTQSFNFKQKRVGHLFQGRYKAIIVDKDTYLLSLCRYIVLNPIRAGIAKELKDWHWSSYNATAGRVEPITCLMTDWILSQFDEDKNKAKRKYKNFVIEKETESPWEALIGQVILGRNSFVEKITGLLKEKEDIKEIPRVQRYATRPDLTGLLKKDRLDKTIFEAYTKYGYTMKEIAENLGVHYSTVSRIIKRLEGRTR
jgi:AraC-like DNA-binding protein